jgi:hypothetical protein
MKRRLIFTAVILMVTVWVLPANMTAQEAGQCYFQANEDIYLKIYHLDKDGVKHWKSWEGHLPEGATKAYNAPYGQVGYATKINPEDPWDESFAECLDGAAIEIP